MKDFSNETKSKRIKAVLKVILKRYSFIIWLPLLLCISYNVGKFIAPYIFEIQKTDYPILDIVTFTIFGFLFLGLLCELSILIIAMIYHGIIIPLKEKKFFGGLKELLEIICMSLFGLLFGLCNLLLIILLQILKSPIYLCKRIKDEKRRFQNAVEEQIIKDNQQKFGEIDN